MPLPLVIGHEGSGEVVELGSAIKDVKVGDHVAFQFSPSCGRCRRCLEGRPQVCELAAGCFLQVPLKTLRSFPNDDVAGQRLHGQAALRPGPPFPCHKVEHVLAVLRPLPAVLPRLMPRFSRRSESTFQSTDSWIPV